RSGRGGRHDRRSLRPPVGKRQANYVLWVGKRAGTVRNDPQMACVGDLLAVNTLGVLYSGLKVGSRRSRENRRWVGSATPSTSWETKLSPRSIPLFFPNWR